MIDYITNVGVFLFTMFLVGIFYFIWYKFFGLTKTEFIITVYFVTSIFSGAVNRMLRYD